MRNQRFTQIALAILLICWLFGFAPKVDAQTDSKINFITNTFRADTTIMDFRGDTLIIIDGATSYMTTEGRIILANLDYFGIEYWDILKKHDIRFDTYLQKQIDRIFENERWIKKCKNDLDSLKALGANSNDWRLNLPPIKTIYE